MTKIEYRARRADDGINRFFNRDFYKANRPASAARNRAIARILVIIANLRRAGVGIETLRFWHAHLQAEKAHFQGAKS